MLFSLCRSLVDPVWDPQDKSWESGFDLEDSIRLTQLFIVLFILLSSLVGNIEISLKKVRKGCENFTMSDVPGVRLESGLVGLSILITLLFCYSILLIPKRE